MDYQNEIFILKNTSNSFHEIVCREAFSRGDFSSWHENPGVNRTLCSLAGVFQCVDFDRLSTGQIISLHDCDRDGVPEYHSIWTVVEFSDGPLACRDPYDPRHLIIPRSGFYRVLVEPVRVVVLPENKQEPAGFLRMRDHR